jgi:diaminopimelate decarboxylase
MPLQRFPFKEDEIVDIARKCPTPFHIYHEQTIRDTVRGLNKAFSWCPSYKNYFAVKATPNPYIMHVLREENCGADCSSGTELTMSEKIGLQGEDIMFTSNNTPLKEFRQAMKLGAIVNFDDLSHVKFLHEQEGLPELVSFRFNPGPERTGNVLIGDPKEAKFGTTMSQLLEGYKLCQQLGVKRFGLHAMVVSNCLEVEELVETARMLFTIAGQVKDKLGIRIEMINLGGGIGIPYKPGEKWMDPAPIGAGIHKVYKELIEAKGLGPVRIVTECGRYITGPAGFLVSRVVHRKRIYKNYVGVDACMANLMRPGMYDAYHHITCYKDESPPQGLPARGASVPDNSKDLVISQKGVYDVVGGLCENNDKFAVNRPLDPEPRVGDVCVIHDAGAHGHSMGFNYNGKPRSAEYLYRPDGSVLQIRRKEELGDLFATIDFDAAGAKFGQGGILGSLARTVKAVTSSPVCMAAVAAGVGAAVALKAAKR